MTRTQHPATGQGTAIGHRRWLSRIAGTALGLAAVLCIGTAPSAAQTVDPNAQNVPSGSPVQNDGNGQAQPRGPEIESRSDTVQPIDINRPDRRQSRTEQDAGNNVAPAPLPPPEPSEFEQFVERSVGRRLPRFGASLLAPGSRNFAVPATSTVPPDYVLNVGDVVSIGLTGSVEGTVDREIDTEGRIFLPRVGAFRIAGIQYRDLAETVSAAVGRQYRGYQVTASIKELRGIRVYVTGFAARPGAYTVSSLSTMVNAVFAAGGPTPGGSFRAVQLYRNGRLVGSFDLYNLVLGGDRTDDLVLQNEDVLFIQPVGNQVAVTGSVNGEAIFEARPGESLEALLAYAGGPNALADRTRMLLFRSSDPAAVSGLEIGREQARTTLVQGGDIIQVLSIGTLVRPQNRQSVVVRIEGEVNAPGNYFVAPNTTLDQLMQLAGGTTPDAFVYGTRFERASVQRQQRESFAEAINQLEISLAASPLTADSALTAETRAAQLAGAQAVLARLRAAAPDGRLVLDLPTESSQLPGSLTLENNDRITIPARPTTVGVFGAVYRPASFALNDGARLRVRDYVDRAGGPLRSADRGQVFVVRANGEVLSHRRGAMSATVLPGDVIFVPVRTQSTSILAKISQISAVIFQLGLGAAAFQAVTQ